MKDLHFDIDTEAVTLMELLLSPTKENIDRLSDADFCRDLHGWVFRAIKTMLAQGKEIEIRGIMGLVREQTGNDFGSAIVRMLKHADLCDEVAFAERIRDEGISQAVKRPAVDLDDCISRLKALTKCRMVESLTNGIIARIRKGEDIAQQLNELNRVLKKGRVRGYNLDSIIVNTGRTAE